MLKLSQIQKDYFVADTKTEALKNINLCFRKNEFVSILGPSGCGKTTMLNIIGGLDQYTSGDLTINGKSTKEYKNTDWDIYRNHRIGFIFQSYNLIPHQTVLENVELALTISGISKSERIEKAKIALDRVGLSIQYNKRPNQLSGGQCQRVAIARALVNEPEILLADEPTGALDTTTSVQIMDLMKSIAQERLVIMVTHNPELAYKYSTRIIKLLDGSVVEDSNPYPEAEEEEDSRTLIESEKKLPTKTYSEKAKMSLWTAFKLSARNLFTKRARTILTCLAGSIGIIGVSMVLAVSSGVKGYVNDMQDDMLSGYPIQVKETSYDLNSILTQMSTSEKLEVIGSDEVRINSIIQFLVEKFSGDTAFIGKNDITRDYLNYISSMPKEYYKDLSLDYGINLNHNIYTNHKVNSTSEAEGVSLTTLYSMYTKTLKDTKFGEYSNLISQFGTTISQSISNQEYILSQYDLLGNSKVATEKNEIMLVLNQDSAINDLTMALLGYYDQSEFISLAMDYDKEDVNLKKKFSYEELLQRTFMYYPNDTIYKKNTNAITSKMTSFNYMGYSDAFDKSSGLELKVVGILKPKENVSYGSLEAGFYYTRALTDHARQSALKSMIYEYAKENSKDSNTYVFGTRTEVGVENAIGLTYHYYDYLGNRYDNQYTVLSSSSAFNLQALISGGGMSNEFGPSIRELGGCELANSVTIYPLSFEEKFLVTEYLSRWNSEDELTFTYFDEGTNQSISTTLAAENRSTVDYTDMLQIVISLINGMIEIVTIALIAFTSLALIVSCVMIAIITYVSVIERIKEIGIIRSLGGRKKDVSHLFNAETFIIGAAAGVIGIVATYLLSLILNVIMRNVIHIQNIAILPWYQGLIMIGISIALTCISGLIPAHSAAKKNPVIALRTE